MAVWWCCCGLWPIVLLQYRQQYLISEYQYDLDRVKFINSLVLEKTGLLTNCSQSIKNILIILCKEAAKEPVWYLLTIKYIGDDPQVALHFTASRCFLLEGAPAYTRVNTILKLNVYETVVD